MSGKKEKFVPLEVGKVKLYLCGPTVYDYLHIGNFRGPITFNLMRNWMEHIGYKVEMAYNYTDVDDKILKRANDEGVSPSEISEKYIAEFEKDSEGYRYQADEDAELKALRTEKQRYAEQRR